MGFSPLANMKRRIPHGNRFEQRKSKITGFTIHHHAGVDAMGEATNPNRVVSANYWIANDGTIIPHIDEIYRAWTTGAKGYPAGAASDHRNITVEVSNSPEGIRNKTYAISPAAMRSLIALIGDVFKRHGLGVVKRGKTSGVAVHRDFVPTSCPGPYIMKNLGHIIAEAEKARKGGKPGPAQKPGGTSKPSPITPPATTSPSVRKIQQDLNRYANAGLYVDGVNGPVTKAWVAWVKDAQHTHLPAFKGVPKLLVDGHYGPVVANAVKTLQRRNRKSVKPWLVVDGVLGPITIRFMRRHGSKIKNRPKNRP